MKYTDYTGIVPPQEMGKELEMRAECRHNSMEKADGFFVVAMKRLLDVNYWHETAGLISAKFELMNAQGEPLSRQVEEGDYIRIDIPGPGSTTGEGFDWVRVISMREYEKGDVRSVAFQVRPTPSPLNAEESIAHFYGGDATSTFAVNQEREFVGAFVIDRNLVPNDEGAHVLDMIRNSAIGLSAIGLFSKIQWQGLVDGIVKS